MKKCICIGKNYAKHIEELNSRVPEYPVMFIKPTSAILEDGAPFRVPFFSNDVQYEVEVLIEVGKKAKNVPKEDAASYINRIGLGIDFTARDLQTYLKDRGLPWEKAKAFDGAAYLGHTWLDPERIDLDNLEFSLNLNGKTVQESNTGNMLFSVPTLIEQITIYFTLNEGDVIFTGTPAGVGKIIAGDLLEGYIENQKMFELKIE